MQREVFKPGQLVRMVYNERTKYMIAEECEGTLATVISAMSRDEYTMKHSLVIPPLDVEVLYQVLVHWSDGTKESIMADVYWEKADC